MSKNLHTKWNAFYDYQQRSKVTQDTWKDSLVKSCIVTNVPSLRFMLDNLGMAEEWPNNSNIHFFRDGIEPMWEDNKNINGGKWVLELAKGGDVSEERINDIWTRTVLFCASEQADNEIICGCVFSPRKYNDRIAVWTKSKDFEVMDVAKKWKQGADFTDKIEFKLHENSLKGLRDRNLVCFTL